MSDYITVWTVQENQINDELCFSSTLGRGDYTINIVAGDYYNLFVNGTFVCYGPARAASGYARADEINLSKFLTRDENEILVFVVSLGVPSLCYSGQDPFFGAVVRLGETEVKNTLSFICYKASDRVRLTDRASSQRGFTEVYDGARGYDPLCGDFIKTAVKVVPTPKILPRNVAYSLNARVSAREYDKGFVFYDEKGVWNGGITIALDEGRLKGSPKRDECTVALSRELAKFDFTRKTEKSGYRYITFAFAAVECGKFNFTVKVQNPSDIWLIYDDCLTDGFVSFKRESITHGLKWQGVSGDAVCYSSEVYSAKFVTFVIKGDAEITDFTVIRIENPETDGLAFASENEKLEKLVEVARRNAKHNYYDVLTDCPSRERAGWLCDGYFSAIAEKFFTGKNTVEKNFLENYDLFKGDIFKSDGVLPMCYPSVVRHDKDFIPNWILWFIVETVDEIKRSGVAASEKRKSRVKAIIEYFKGYENEYGLLENLDGWVFVEWSKADELISGVNFPTNMLYCGALYAACEILGDKALSEKAEKVKRAITELSFNGKYFRDHALRENGKLVVQKEASETCQYYAAFFGVITKTENSEFYASALDRFKEYDLYPSNIFIGYVLRLGVLAREGENERLIDECIEKFYPMAEETGTLWELFSGPSSKDHGFAAIIAKYAVYAVLGIVDLDYANKKLTVCDPLKISASVVLPCENGEKITIVNDNAAVEISVPDGYEIIRGGKI